MRGLATTRLAPFPREDFMIPQEKREAVTRGLRGAFGVTKFEDISRMTGGVTSSLVFRIIVRGSPYLLKSNGEPGQLLPKDFTGETAPGWCV